MSEYGWVYSHWQWSAWILLIFFTLVKYFHDIFQDKKNSKDIIGGKKWLKISPFKRLQWSAPKFKGLFTWYDSGCDKTVSCVNTIIEIHATYSKMKLQSLSNYVNSHTDSNVTYYLRQLLSQSLSYRLNGPLIGKNGTRPNQWQQPPR